MEATVEKVDARQFGRHAKDADRCIGARIRERRMLMGLTQQELAEMTGVTYQQMHKYEKSTNRIAAGRLYTLAQALGVDVDYFYQDMTAAGAPVERLAQQRLLLELARNFMGISKLEHQKAICDLARALKEQDAGIAPEVDSQAS